MQHPARKSLHPHMSYWTRHNGNAKNHSGTFTERCENYQAHAKLVIALFHLCICWTCIKNQDQLLSDIVSKARTHERSQFCYVPGKVKNIILLAQQRIFLKYRIWFVKTHKNYQKYSFFTPSRPALRAECAWLLAHPDPTQLGRGARKHYLSRARIIAR